ncbi:Right handed beta helix region [Bryocella elongata]|uniref:Right handed beta helix region n=1 Tax=Bryocella elongata TaxID=863522 RepID=A0A1H5WS32_9BACT|nr:right-handed parallel beta-helix repeat-containing protein [Bryocella elongata]SEG02155.1 Right handed beta helix region [Bryocella elongata]
MNRAMWISATMALALTVSGFAEDTPLIKPRRFKEGIVFAISPQGDDASDGSPAHPFRTIERAQAAVRKVNAANDVTVKLADGLYRIDRSIVFRAEDGGRNEHHVAWEAMDGAKPQISGAVRIEGWKIFDRSKGIYVADVPAGVDTRQLWIDGRLAHVGRVEVPRKAVEFSERGLFVKDPAFAYLTKVAHPERMELHATGFFTERISPVARVDGASLLMKQPAWDNNLWGYDTVEKPFHPELSHLYLANALEFVSEPGDWYLDPAKHKLYVKFPSGADPQAMDVELPRLTVLLAVTGTLDAPVDELSFRGITFEHTTWLGPSGDEGYASQQSGSFVTGHADTFPADVVKSCPQGCTQFERTRSEWSQMPASIQVAAAERITFDHDTFAHLGQYALGIGNDADAVVGGVGLATGDVQVLRCEFFDDAGGAVLAGGVQHDAHHPRDPRMTNRALVIANNAIHDVSKDYEDNAAILSTYVEGAAIVHNEISAVPYDAIDIGYGWGINDPGGNANYRYRMHGYDYPQNVVYSTPTTHHDVVVASNRIHDAKRLFQDGGAIYNLSASAGTLITENYIYDNHGQIGLYLDEGSHGITVRRNVVDDPKSEWLNVNTVKAFYPLRVSTDNTALGNWHNGTKVGGMWTNYQNDLILDDHLVMGGQWPAEAQDVMKASGIEAEH